MALTPWNEIQYSQEMYDTYVEPIHQVLEQDSEALWLDQDGIKLAVDQEGTTTRIHGYYKIHNGDAQKVFDHMYREELRKQVDSTIAQFSTIETVDERTDVVYHHSRFPLNILRQRDAVIWRRVLERDPARGLFALLWVPCAHPEHPPATRITRIRSSGCYRIVQQADHVDVYSLVFSDLGGAIPMSVIRMSSVPLLLACRARIEQRCQRGENYGAGRSPASGSPAGGEAGSSSPAG